MRREETEQSSDSAPVPSMVQGAEGEENKEGKVSGAVMRKKVSGSVAPACGCWCRGERRRASCGCCEG